MFKPWPSRGIVPRGQGSPKEEQTFFLILPGKQKGLAVGGGVHLQNKAQSCPLSQSQAAALEIATPPGWVWTPGQVHSIAWVQEQHFIYSSTKHFCGTRCAFPICALMPILWNLKSRSWKFRWPHRSAADEGAVTLQKNIKSLDDL